VTNELSKRRMKPTTFVPTFPDSFAFHNVEALQFLPSPWRPVVS